MMLRSIVATVLACQLQANALIAQQREAEPLRMPNQSVYVELGGNGGYASVNYDRKLNSRFTARIGRGRWAQWAAPLSDQDSESARLTPVTLNVLTRVPSTRAHWLEIGAGMVYGQRWRGIGGIPHPIRAATATVAYRGMDRRNIMRLGLAYLHPLDAAFPLHGMKPAVSFGFVF